MMSHDHVSMIGGIKISCFISELNDFKIKSNLSNLNFHRVTKLTNLPNLKYRRVCKCTIPHRAEKKQAVIVNSYLVHNYETLLL